MNRNLKKLSSILLLLATILPFMPFTLFLGHRASSAKNIFLYSSFGLSAALTIIATLLALWSLWQACRAKKVGDAALSIILALLGLLPFGVMLYLLAKLNFLMNPG